MKRKVVKHGPSTYVISLPSEWVKKYNVAKGDELDVNANGSELLINSEKSKTNFSIEKDVSRMIPRLADRFLARAYQKGYDNIKLIHNDVKILETIRKKVPELIGYEIMEQNEKSCLIQSISDKIEIDFDNSLRRAFLIAKQMLQACYDAYNLEDKSTLDTIYLKDLELNRLCYFCLRQINKKHYSNPENAQEYHMLYYLIEILEDLGDIYKKLSKELIDIEWKNSDIKLLLKRLIEQFEISHLYFYDATKEKANKAYEIYEEINFLVEDALEKPLKKEGIKCLFSIKTTARIVYHFTTMRLDFIKN